MTIEAEGDTRRKEAAEWFARLNQRKVSTEDVKGFSAWRRDPANARAFERVQSMWDAAATLGQTQEIADLRAAAKERGRNGPSRSHPRLTGLIKPLGAAGAVALALGLVGWVWQAQQPTVYATAVGEQRVIRLDDGSRITLDTASEVAVRYTGDRRGIVLRAGQAQFDVEADVSRPFVVSAGQTQVTAPGTRFDVRRFGEGARVVLAEGRVSVADSAPPDRRWSLTPGQQVVTTAPRPEVVPIDLPAATSWTTGRLIFDNTPISVAVAEVNRYSKTPMELDDPSIASIRVSGAFDAGDVDGFVAALQDLYPLQASRSSNGRTVLKGSA